MLMHNPPFQGETIKELCLDPLGLSVTEAARVLGVSGKSGISLQTTLRFSIAFNTSSESWLNQQTPFDLLQVEQHRGKLQVKCLFAA